MDYCLEVYRHYRKGEQFDYFLSNGWEIKRTLSRLHLKMIRFKKNIIKFYKQIKKAIQKEINYSIEFLKITKNLYKWFKNPI